VFFIAGGKKDCQARSGGGRPLFIFKGDNRGIGEELMFGQLLQLAIVLIGFYVMFRGLFPRSWKKDQD
jgi:hypothetical protein